jgi:excisionase family DNA binding protein
MTAGPAALGPVPTVEKAAASLRMSGGLPLAAVSDGSLPSLRVGRRILLPSRQLEVLLEGHAQQR